MIIGKHTYGAQSIVILFPDANLIIGNYCSIAEGCQVFLGGNHQPSWISTFPFYEKFPGSCNQSVRSTKGDIVVGNDVWIGHGVTILSGVKIGDGAIVGAMSVVASNISPYSIACGNPATIKKYRFSKLEIKYLLQLKWWEWPDEDVRNAAPFLMTGDISGLVAHRKGK
jgi:acetyltransferase-like isoleucine patch superfamily enzyme